MSPLSWISTVTHSLSYIGSFTISGSGLLTRISLPLFDVDGAMGIVGIKCLQGFFIQSYSRQCAGSPLLWLTFTNRNLTLTCIWLAFTMINKSQGRQKICV